MTDEYWANIEARNNIMSKALKILYTEPKEKKDQAMTEQDKAYAEKYDSHMRNLSKAFTDINYKVWSRDHCVKCASGNLDITYIEERDVLVCKCLNCKRTWEQEPHDKHRTER